MDGVHAIDAEAINGLANLRYYGPALLWTCVTMALAYVCGILNLKGILQVTIEIA